MCDPVMKEFIESYENLPQLWDPNHKHYTNKYLRKTAIKSLVPILRKSDKNATHSTVTLKINSLRSNYRKELRKYFRSKTIEPDGTEVYNYTPRSWRFHALRFIDGIERKNTLAKLNGELLVSENEKVYDDSNEGSESVKDEMEIPFVEDILDTNTTQKSGSDDGIEYTYITTTFPEETNKQKHQHRNKKMKTKNDNYYNSADVMDDRELEAIGANVTCKLKRMCPNQRCHAELLINKVLISGLNNKLNDDTDLTELQVLNVKNLQTDSDTSD